MSAVNHRLKRLLICLNRPISLESDFSRYEWSTKAISSGLFCRIKRAAVSALGISTGANVFDIYVGKNHIDPVPNLIFAPA